MMLAGFTSPNSTTLRRAVPYHEDMDLLLGDWSPIGEPLYCLGSLLFGILFCKLVFEISRSICPAVFSGYGKLSKAEQLEWNNRAFSTGHAVVSSCIAYYLLYISDIFQDSTPYGPVVFQAQFSLNLVSQQQSRDMHFWTSVTIVYLILLGLGLHFLLKQFSCGYFMADMGMIIFNYPHLGGFEFIAHHLVSMLSLVLAVHSGHAHLYLYTVLLSECTTPFINLRWYLIVLGLKNSQAYVINGAVTALLWLVARVILFLVCYVHMYLHYDQIKQLHMAGYVFLLLAPTSLGAMNLFWFLKIVKAMLRTLQSKKVD